MRQGAAGSWQLASLSATPHATTVSSHAISHTTTHTHVLALQQFADSTGHSSAGFALGSSSLSSNLDLPTSFSHAILSPTPRTPAAVEEISIFPTRSPTPPRTHTTHPLRCNSSLAPWTASATSRVMDLFGALLRQGAQPHWDSHGQVGGASSTTRILTRLSAISPFHLDAIESRSQGWTLDVCQLSAHPNLFDTWSALPISNECFLTGVSHESESLTHAASDGSCAARRRADDNLWLVCLSRIYSPLRSTRHAS